MASFFCSCVAWIVGLKVPVPYITGIIGCLASLLGLTLLVNLNGTADHLIFMVKTKRWLGADYSNSGIARPVYVRVFGAGFAALNAVFVIVVITGHNP
ncbi:MAG: hypothetical protein ACRDQZ_05115 [Mycobacteriales bacterium]